MDPRTDANLVAETLGGGSADPFCALVRRYQGRVYAVAVGSLADFDLALGAATRWGAAARRTARRWCCTTPTG